MRDDMAKVLVERPRVPPFNVRKGRRQAIDDLPSCEGLRRAASLRGERKQLNENLAPLRRYLERQVGRPWNKVYSELAAKLRVTNVVQQHVREHLSDFVAVKPRRLNHVRGTGSRTLWWQPLYVDPVTGLLCRTDKLPEEKARRSAERRTRAADPPERIPLAEDRELRRIHGIWYEVRLVPLPKPHYQPYPDVQKRPLKPYNRCSPVIEVIVIVRRLITPAVWDVVTNTLVEAGPATDDPAAWNAHSRQNPSRTYAIAKRALSRRELRRHGISNQPRE